MLATTIILLILFVVGVPIGFALGMAPLAGLLERGMPLLTIPQAVFEILDSFALLAVAYFVLAGRLMQASGLARRLVEFAQALVGWMAGGLGGATVLTAMLFSTMSGSSSATAAAVGTMIGPELKKQNYPIPFVGAVIAGSAELGAIIPPSIAMIIYAVLSGISIGQLFLAGVVPGLLIGFSLIGLVVFTSRRHAYGIRQRLGLRQWALGLLVATRRSFLALLTPAIILGGIYGGVFTATEAAAVAVAYTLFLGLFVYRELHISALPKIFFEAALTTAIVMIIVGFASVLAYVLVINQVPALVARHISDITDQPWVFLLVVNVLLLIAGMFIESIAAMIILVPILTPVAASFGIDPIHLGVIVICNLAIGMVTPPIGVNLYVACSTFNIRIEQMIRPLLPILLVLVTNLILITYLPWLSLVLIR
ncbi:MAG: membrane protein [Alphaproteobacteria bacterium]|nr:MAG: membrane protein [Alphaproteobacteria bacterium]